VPNSILTLTTSLGNFTGIDADSVYDGFQVQADAGGNFTFALQRPSFVDPPESAGNQTAVINALAIDGSRQGNTTQLYTPQSHVLNPNLSVSNATGNEDTAIPLTINSALNDLDGSETLTITITGVPAGATLSTGTDNGGGNWSLTQGQLAGLTLTPPRTTKPTSSWR
jgi:hypothetical protein